MRMDRTTEENKLSNNFSLEAQWATSNGRHLRAADAEFYAAPATFPASSLSAALAMRSATASGCETYTA